jgi:hypothetical protein
MSGDGMMGGRQRFDQQLGQKATPLTPDQLIEGVKQTVQMCLDPQEEITQSSKKINVHFFEVAVQDNIAPILAEDLAVYLSDLCTEDFLRKGPSYIELGAVLGDQRLALTVMAVGEALRLWEVITPAKLGVIGVPGDQMAGQGCVLTDGFKRPVPNVIGDLIVPRDY